LSQTAVILTCLGVVLAVALYVSARPTRAQQVSAVVIGLGTIIGVGSSSESLYHHIYEKLQWSTGYNDHESFKHIIENKSGVITVNEDDQIYGGGLYDGKFSTDLIDDMNMIGRAYSLSLFHPAPRQMLMIGLSSGSWAAVLANHPQLEKLTIIEINPGYLGLIEQYPEQTQILSDPRVEIIIDDGRRFLNRTDETYDAIIINTTYNWRSQISNLLSVEFNELIQAHLKPGGLYQFNTTGSAESIQAAFEVFPYVAGVLNHVIVSDTPFDVNKARWESILRSYEIYGEPVFDLSLNEHQEHLDWLLAQAELLYTEPPPDWAYAVGWEYFLPQPHMRLAAGDAVPITDDNMGTEWPDPEIEWFAAE
jgi:spermidine synthase